MTRDTNRPPRQRLVAAAAVVTGLVLNNGLEDFAARHDTALFDRAFLWQGDVRILLAIVKYIEDSSTSLTTPLRSASMPRGDEGYLDVLDRAIELSKSATTCNQTAARCSSEDSECPVSALENGADGQTRTDDLLITNQLLYQLSYVGHAGGTATLREKDSSIGHRIAAGAAVGVTVEETVPGARP